MADKKTGTLNVRLENSPPRPVGGEGEVTFQVGENELVLKWVKGRIVDVTGPALPESSTMSLRETDPTTLEAVACYKCWVDTDSGAWICLPTAC